MLSFPKNIYTWDKSAHDVTSSVTSLDYSTDDQPLDVSSLRTPVQFFISVVTSLPRPNVFNLTVGERNFHQLSIVSEDESAIIELFPGNCSDKLDVLVQRDELSGATSYQWIKEIRSSRSGSFSTCFSDSYEYTLAMSNVRLKIGNYSIGVRVAGAVRDKDDTSIEYAIRILKIKCLYFDEAEERWRGDGCSVGAIVLKMSAKTIRW